MDVDLFDEDSDSAGSDDISVAESVSGDENLLDEDLETENELSQLGAIDLQDETEKEINDDFSRLIGNIRETDDLAADGHVRKGWEIPIEEDQQASFRDNLRAASGVGRIKRKQGGRRTWNQPVLTQQVKNLIGKGSQAYVDQQIDIAIKIMQEVIRLEPRATAAWSILIACHRDLGQFDKTLQLGIMSAHLDGDYEQWFKLAEESKEQGYVMQAMYCYRKASQLDPQGVDADWERASLAKAIGDLKTAKLAYLTILRRYPHDVTVLTELRPVLIETSDLALCLKLYNAAFEHYRSLYPSGKVTAADDAGVHVSVPGGGFVEFHVYVLADIYNIMGESENAIQAIKLGVRWLQGRADQVVWANVSDDREYDSVGISRLPRDEPQDDVLDVPAGNYPLDVNARHRLAIARIKMGDMEESKLHVQAILRHSMQEYAALFQEIADAYFEKELYDLALPIYEDLASDQQTSNMNVLLQTATCRRHLNDLKGAMDVYTHVIANWPDNTDARMLLAEVYEIMGEPKKALNLVYQVIDMRKRKSSKTGAGASYHNAIPSTSAAGATTSLFEERPSSSSQTSKTKSGVARLTTAQLKAFERERQEKIDHSRKRCDELHAAMVEGDTEAEAEWLIEAEKLVEHFRETRQLFATAKNTAFSGLRPSARSARKRKDSKKSQKEREQEVDDVASRLQLEIAYESTHKEKLLISIDDGKLTIFRGISIDDWFTLILEYAFLLDKRGLYGISSEVLRHVRISIVFQDQHRQVTLRLSLIACAMRNQDYEVITEQCRALINMNQFNNEPLRILLISLGVGYKAADAFIDTNLQKHLFRELRLSDDIVHGKEVKFNSALYRYSLRDEKGESDAREVPEKKQTKGKGKNTEERLPPSLPTTANPFHAAIYGMACCAGRSYQSALFYLLQAYHLHADDPVICLSLAIACLGRAMQRQADNRNYMVVQGFAFLSQYRTLRGGDEGDVDEVEFNFGRAFQQLGLHSHAVKHYEKILANAERMDPANQSPNTNLSKEAAYNLSLIYVTSGAARLAEELYRKWLSI